VGGPGADGLRQRGAALLDLVVGAAAALVLFGLAASALHELIVAAAKDHATFLARTQSDALLAHLRADAASAWSVSVPVSDIAGAPNADGHELDVVVQDAARRVFTIAYVFDPGAQTVTRYLVAPAASPQPGDRATAIAGFAAAAYPATAVTTPGGAIYDPLFAGTTVTPVDYAMPDGTRAGNGFVSVTISGANTSASALLATNVAPTQFTVVVKYTPPP
jgi:hypothetical protein